MNNENNHEDRGRKRFHLGAWTYDGYERKFISLPLPVAAQTEIYMEKRCKIFTKKV